ncbi:Ig-like domain-containing protein [Undibacterium flavidum]|uniref:DUF4347 domain-containing protein n=1 Tax=Undibacterium flavidum TaxID=2762297 RepID=A0ABR6YGT7_9BURK|nr:Ig-like domain-containing protein [Undibacterium flavidum]MBC3875799.1 DUF4347 domain-containing protein [Undibacterium flavidum]
MSSLTTGNVFDMSILNAASQNPVASGKTVLVVDSRLPDFQSIVNAAKSGVIVIVLDQNQNGIKQIADALKGISNIDSISIVSHGNHGMVLLGDSPLHLGNVDQYASELKSIGESLSADGDIALYGCDVGSGSDGVAFMNALAAATGADIAASSDDTGSANRNGNWELEISTGDISQTPILDLLQLRDWDHLASTGSANSQATLVSAIAAAVGDGSDDTITLTGDFTLTSAVTIAVNDGKTLTIVGAGYKIDGNNASRLLVTGTTNAGSTISLQNLTLANGFLSANGGDSLSSGAVAGGDALGAAISNSGTLNISGVTFSGNKAAGGGGGAAGPGGQSGGGGGGGGFGTTNGGSGGANDTYTATSPSAGKGGNGAGTNSAPEIGGYGGTTTGGKAGALAGGSTGGKGATASDGTSSIGGGGGGGGNYAAGGRGGNAVGAIYNNGGTVKISSSTFSNNIAAGGGGGGGSVYANFPGNGGNGGYGVAAIWNKSGTVSADASTKTSITGATNVGKGGYGGYAKGGGGSAGSNRGANQTLGTIGTLIVAPTVLLSTNNSSIAESAGMSTITATLSSIASTDTIVTIAATGTATGSGTDYTLSSTSIKILAGNLTGTALVTAVQDTLDEPNETVIVDIISVSGGDSATESGTQQQTITITDDDATPSLSIANVSQAEGNSGSTNLTFTVTLSAASAQAVSVNYATINGTASAGSDYTAASGTLNFAAGETTKTFNVVIAGDSTIESDEDFTVTLSSPTNATLGTANATGTITDDDSDNTPPVVSSITRVDTATSNATSVQYTVKFSEDVTGVDAGDFSLTTSGTSGTVSNVTGSGDTYTVTVNTITGDGTLRLDLVASGSGIADTSTKNNAIDTDFTSGEVYTFDHTAPATPSTPDLAPASDSGIFSFDNYTSVTTPLFNGTGEIGSTVTLYDTSNSNAVLGTKTVNGAGKWSITSTTLTEGTHVIVAKASDTVGNLSSNSSSLSVTIDKTAPASAPGDVALTDAEDSGTSNTDNITNFSTPLLYGNGAVKNQWINLYENDGLTLVDIIQADSQGHWEYTYSPSKGDGTYKMVARSVDLAGNVGPASNTFTLTVDTTSPSTPDAPDLVSGSDSGISATDDITNDNTPTVSGVTEANASVTLYDTDDTTVLGITTSDGSGNWSIISSTLKAGSHDLKVEVVDVAGNNSGLSAALTVTIDTTGPTTANKTMSLSADTGSSSSDFITKTASQTISGTVDADLANDEVVEVSVNNGASWTVATGAAGQKSWSASGLTLVGSDTIKVRVVDTAGNSGTVASQAYTLDQTAPAAPTIALDSASDSGSSNSDGITNKVNPVIRGTTIANASVELFDTGGVTVLGTTTADGSGNWSITSSKLASGSHTLTAKATDIAGNVSAASASTIVKIDTTAPALLSAITISDTALKIGDTAQVKFSFTEAVSGFTTADVAVPNGQLTGLSSSDGGVNWSATLTPNSNVTNVSNTLTLSNIGYVDLAGNAGVGSSLSPSYSVDTMRPSLTTGISISDTSLKIGDTANLSFVFAEAITGFTTADLNSPNAVISNLVSGDGGVTWTATLTPNANSSINTNLITLDYTGILDLKGNAGTGSATSKNYVVDTVPPNAPSITISDSNLTVGETATVSFTFAEPVSGFSIADVAVENGVLSNLLTTDNIHFTALLTPTDKIADSTNTLTVDCTGISDLAGNAGIGTLKSSNYAIDTTRPVLASAISISDTALKIGDTATVSFSFNKAASNFTSANIIAENGVISNLISNDGGISWTASLTAKANINDSTNVVGISLEGVNLGSSGNYSIDTVRPSLASTISWSDTALAVGETAQVTITFSEAITDFTNADLTVENGILSPLSSTNGGITWTATFTPTNNLTDATNSLSLNLAGISDLAGNAGTGSASSPNYAIDTLRPTATISFSDTALIAGESAIVTITFSEAVSDLTNADLTIANGTLTSVSSSNGGLSWSATFTPTVNLEDSSNVIVLNNAGVIDAAGNTGLGSTSSANYSVDTLRPTANIGLNISLNDSALNVGESATVTITFSEPVVNFTNADLTVENGILSPLSSTDGGITWIATLTPSNNLTDATNSLSLNLAGISDLAGNAGIGSASSPNYAIDTLRPTATISFSDTALIAGESAIVTITFSEAVSDLTNADLTIANGTLTPVSSSNGGLTWSATFTPTVNLEDSSNVIVLNNTGVIDAAGNTGLGSTSSANYSIDTLRPTSSISLNDSALSIGESAIVTITFSEPVSNFSNADLSLTHGTLSAVSSTDGGRTWSATLTPEANVTATNNLITLDNAGVNDAAGNAGSGITSSAAYKLDTVRPSATLTLADNQLTAGETTTLTVQFSEAVTNFSNADLSIENGALSQLESTNGGTTWTATFTPAISTSDASNVIVLNNTTYTDLNGNIGTGTSSSSNYSVDTLRPAATISLNDNNLLLGETANVSFSFNRPVTGFTNADLTVENGSLSAVTSTDGGLTWSAIFTPSAFLNDSTNLITLNQAGVMDAAGNVGVGNATSANFSIDTRNTLPSIVGTQSGQSINSNNTVKPFSNVTIVDSDLGAMEKVTVRLDNADKGSFTAASLALAGFSSNDGGLTYTSNAAASPANIQAALRALVFQPNASRVSVGNTDTTTFTVSVNDGIETANNANTSVITTAVNSAPSDIALSNTLINQSANALASLGLLSSTDINLGDTHTYTLVNSPASNDNVLFTLDGNQVKVKTPGLIAAGNYQLAVRTTDAAGASFIKTFTVGVKDDVAPKVVSIDGSFSTSQADQVDFLVQFSEEVTGVNLNDFSLLASGGANGTLKEITQINASTYRVSVNHVAGNGSLRLDLNSVGSGIADLVSNPISAGFIGSKLDVKTDLDNDNISDTLESKVPNRFGTGTGDGNGDGIADTDQNSVSSLVWKQQPNGVTSYVTLANSEGASQVNVITTPTPTNLPADVSMPFGLLAFDIVDLKPGASTKMSVFVEKGTPINGYWKQDKAGHWVNIADSVTTTGNTIRIDFTLTDGGEFDADGIVNGKISDPGGPGLFTGAAPNMNAFALTEVAPRNVKKLDFNVSFSTAVKNVDITDFALNATGTAQGTIKQVVKISDTLYKVSVDSVTGNGSLVVAVKTGVSGNDITDLYGTALSTTVNNIVTTAPHPLQSDIALHSNSEKIAALYTLMYHRAPDQEGLTYWLNEMAHGKTMTDISRAFASHSRFMKDYATMNNQLFVETLYKDGLGNAGDAQGVSFWINKLNLGQSRADMVAEFALSAMTTNLVSIHDAHGLSDAEFLAATVRQNTLLNRIDLGLEFVKQFGSATNPLSATDLDPAYHAAQLIIAKVNATDESLANNMNTLHATPTINAVLNVVNHEQWVSLIGEQSISM